jgi:hypothetical protein
MYGSGDGKATGVFNSTYLQASGCGKFENASKVL